MNINFKNAKDEKPKHDSLIVLINTNPVWGEWSFDFVEVEYSWDDENGCQVVYDPNSDEIPEGYKLWISMGWNNYFPLDDKDKELFWVYQDDVLELLEKNGL